MNKKTAFKGMTLFEIVISIAIYGTIALLLVEIMGTVNSTMRSTTALNERLSYEEKFADNRMTVADSRGEIIEDADLKSLKITFGADESSMKTISADGRQLEVRYNSGKEYDTTTGVNYRYMIFEDNEIEPEFALPFEIFLKFADNKPKYPVKDIKVYLYGDDGKCSEDPLSDKLRVVDYNPVTHEVKYQQKKDSESGEPVFDDEGNAVMEPVWREDVDRITVDENGRYKIIVPRKNQSAPNGNSRVKIVFIGDVSAETGGDGSVVITDKTDDSTHRADEFPFLKFNLSYCAWVKDGEGHTTGFYYDPEVDFVINNDLTVTAE